MTLQRLVLTFKPEGVEIRTLYRTKNGANPGTKGRLREAAELARSGLTRALEAHDAGGAKDLGTSGYEVREDTIGLTRPKGPTREGSTT